ncbi:unnamed protein product [marine sediment metagenome]|uniref:Nitroreductase domain-containing protein n=1 Tax=marine sediment metagenome TaxID=412755 RepID=X1CIW7_9ZZZZ
MHVHEAIQNRLSIRRYADISIPAEHMDILFKALQLAASGNNYQNCIKDRIHIFSLHFET